MTVVDAKGFLIVEADRRAGRIMRAKIAGLRAKRPARLELDQVAIEVTVRLPVGVFDPLKPAALIVVPEEYAQRAELTVEVEKPEGGSDLRGTCRICGGPIVGWLDPTESRNWSHEQHPADEHDAEPVASEARGTVGA